MKVFSITKPCFKGSRGKIQTKSPMKIVTLDKIPIKILEGIKTGLKGTYSEQEEEIPTGAKLKFPSESLDPSRGQYNANEILSYISGKMRDKKCETLAVTKRDIFSGYLNFVFGIANPKSGVAVISTSRLNRKSKGEGKETGKLIERTKKEAIHEMGHLKGLEHCSDPKCGMSFSNTLGDVDRKKSSLCNKCRNKLGP